MNNQKHFYTKIAEDLHLLTMERVGDLYIFEFYDNFEHMVCSVNLEGNLQKLLHKDSFLQYYADYIPAKYSYYFDILDYRSYIMRYELEQLL